MFYFGVYFRKFMGKIVYTSTLPDYLNRNHSVQNSPPLS